MFPVQVQNYMRQNRIFADAFNYFVYGGEQVINPESLEELDTREIDVPYGGEKGAKQPVQKKGIGCRRIFLPFGERRSGCIKRFRQ